MMRIVLARAFVLALLSVVAALPAHAQSSEGSGDSSLLVLNGGLFDLVSHRSQEAEGRIEYRSGFGFFESDGSFRGFKPLVGIMGNTAGAAFGYAGFAAPFAFDDDKWEFIPAAGLGAYHRGNGINLGGIFEFHLSLGGSYQIAPGQRLGLVVDHISNAHIHPQNPGVNSILVSWAFALD